MTKHATSAAWAASQAGRIIAVSVVDLEAERCLRVAGINTGDQQPRSRNERVSQFESNPVSEPMQVALGARA